jgi:hypothetical protein
MIIVRNWLHAFAYCGVGGNLTRGTECYVNRAIHSSMELLERPNPACVADLCTAAGIVRPPEQ